MLRKKEHIRRQKTDLMLSFIILRLISQSLKDENLEKLAQSHLRLGRLKLLDLAVYEMAKKRRAMGLCPKELQENVVSVSQAPSAAVLPTDSQLQAPDLQDSPPPQPPQ